MKHHNPPTLAPGRGYSHAIEVPAGTRVVYLAGQLGLDREGCFASGIAAQGEQAWRNIGTVLGAAGLGYDDIVRVTHYLVNSADIPAYRTVRAKFLGDHTPASTLLVISALARPEALIEVEVVAGKTAPARAAPRPKRAKRASRPRRRG